VDLTVLEVRAELAPLDKLVCEEFVSATVTALPNNVVLTLVEMTVVNVFLDNPVSTIFVLDPVLLNVPELSTVLPRPAVGTDVEETVEVAHPTIVARMESACAILTAAPETAVLTVVEELAVLALDPIPSATTTLLIPYLEPAMLTVTDVVMESALALRLPLRLVPVNSTKPTVPKIVEPSLELFHLLSDKRIN
jgi:hypothetical protein